MKKFIVAGMAVTLALSLSACGSFTKFSDAYALCGSPEGVSVEDGGSTLVIDMAGEDDYYGAGYDSVFCMIHGVSTPSYIVSQMEQTTALAGTQNAEFDGISVSWSYHPNNGLDVVYHKNN